MFVESQEGKNVAMSGKGKWSFWMVWKRFFFEKGF